MTASKPDEAIGYLHEVQGPVVVIRCERMPPLRQEEIIEEIEVILLSSELVGSSGTPILGPLTHINER